MAITELGKETIAAVVAFTVTGLPMTRAQTEEATLQMNTAQGVDRAFKALLQAMMAGDTKALARLLEEEFTLTHITGYRQAGEEWLMQMRQGSFIYHDIAKHSTEVSLDGERAQVVGRTRTDATIYGSRADWRLQLALEYESRGGKWIATRAVATTW
jgi:hypothetical protein